MSERKSIEPSKEAIEAAGQAIWQDSWISSASDKEDFARALQAAYAIDFAKLQVKRDQLRLALQVAEAERDTLRIEYESRAIWIEKMNNILGYDNSDGFHSSPDPHELAERLKLALQDLAEALRSVEWVADNDHLWCPSCGNGKHQGCHRTDCKLAAALKATARLGCGRKVETRQVFT